MSKARLVITAVIAEKRAVREVAHDYGVARSWIYALLARYQAEGEAAFEPRPRRPRTSPKAMSEATVELIVRLRKELAGQGLDAGPHTICWHLRHHHQVTVSASTATPVPGPPLHPRHRLRGPAQGRPQQPGHRHPRPRPHRPHRHQRRRHPPPRRAALPHRRRKNPRPNPRDHARPGPAHPDRRRRHRRAATPAHPQPSPQLPAHRQTTPPTRNTAQTIKPRTLTWVRGFLDVLRHHKCWGTRTRT